MSKYNTSNYEAFYNEAKIFLKNRIYNSYLYRFALGTDASCYRYIPKIVIRAHSEDEIIKILKLARKFNLPITFRAYGSSLSGQALSDSILIITTFGFRDIAINNDSIRLSCGVIGSDANAALKPYNKKIGPDPATITMASIGGIVSNNSSGMCCGVKENSYQTIKSIRVILLDGTILDTSNKESIDSFIKTHKEMINSILNLRAEILEDKELTSLIKKKYKIKNTTGYGINSLVDFENIVDILNHIFVGSEGTLGFISSVELFSVDDCIYKACGLLFYKDMKDASKAIEILAKNENIISSAEIMDYHSLKSVQNIDGVPSIIHKISKDNACILIQTQSNNKDILEKNLNTIKESLKQTNLILTPLYSTNENEYNTWWKIRKGLLPIASANRKDGASVITEDVCFEIEKFGEGVEFIQRLFDEFGFSDNGIIFGHALSGNIHFIITPNLDDKKERENFENLVSKMANGVANFGGSVKAEHGTGRMVAPFVEVEWGKKAYNINKKIKNIFDPQSLLNPDVIISNNPNIHTQNLKEMAKIDDFINKCMECGFCEKACPSNFLTLTPRQRISVVREMQRLLKLNTKDSIKLYDEMKEEYKYAGDETCAACSQCASLCPLEIDTSNIALNLRKEAKKAQYLVKHIYKHLSFYITMTRFCLKLANLFSIPMLNKIPFRKIRLPYIPLNLPQANDFYNKININKAQIKPNLDSIKVIYFSACMNRAFKPSKILANNADKRNIQEVFYSICKKANIEVIEPKNLANMCCGKAFIDYDINLSNLKELKALSNNGKIPIVLDHSACSQHLKNNLKDLKVLDLVEFLLNIKDRLQITKINENISVYAMCALKKNNKGKLIESLAKLCTNGEVINEENIKCCGFAGNKGFFTPELNKNSLLNLRTINGIKRGFSSSSTCEIGLNDYSNIAWQHISYLVDEVSNQP
ncbi:FAD-binding and (Fe-S)-binding domain-containing protein [Helicobacter sp. MIT 14-3879]|uniref:FAD-binding and (Fe-S)-binding domain-containing protein n=1 Tax=Helicobacter sp. MIT 14-3879 TaxID=2040649 RepID=UPI000E1F7DDC|nr:FAD-binding and (Fe-S)-binding domain-containing protein [Helicobacter sp. MIT 14-3879]RDU60926.1 FAD-binding oxidoreductase [Helicobacter sp. MIT 14-3879]